MFYDSKAFRSLESGLGAAYLQQQIASQNLANQETPGYKARSLVFEDVLNRTMQNNQTNSPYHFKGRVITDNSTYTRPDGNNVDANTESLVLYKAYVQASYLTEKINGAFSNFNYVLNNALK